MTEVIADLERNGGNSSTLNDPHAVTTALDKDAITALRNLDVSVATARTAVKKQSPATKPSSGKQPPWKNTKVLIGAGVLGVLMFLGVILIVRDKDGKEVARIDATDGTKVTLPAGGSVQVESTAATPQTKSSPPHLRLSPRLSLQPHSLWLHQKSSQLVGRNQRAILHWSLMELTML